LPFLTFDRLLDFIIHQFSPDKNKRPRSLVNNFLVSTFADSLFESQCSAVFIIRILIHIKRETCLSGKLFRKLCHLLDAPIIVGWPSVERDVDLTIHPVAKRCRCQKTNNQKKKAL